MVGYKVYLKGFGFLKTRYRRKPRIFPSKKYAQRIAKLERTRGKWTTRIVKA